MEINEASIDWWQGGANYCEVVGEAANEAGGHAFATDYFGPSSVSSVAYNIDLDALRGSRFIRDWGSELSRQVPLEPWAASAVVAILGGPSDADPFDVIDCPSCYDLDEAAVFDPDTATDAVYDAVLVHYERVEGLFDHPFLTRMTSSLDAAEMTVDPVFVLNADLSSQDDYVEVARQATLVVDCGARRQFAAAPRRLELSDGREIPLPAAGSVSWPATDFDEIQAHGEMRAKRIAQLGATGSGEVLVDLTEDLNELAGRRGGLRGCTTGRPTLALAWVTLLGLLLLRRRARA